jgi:hypothetical protein
MTLFTVLIVNLRSLAIVPMAPIDSRQSAAPFRLQHELRVSISDPESRIAPLGMTVRRGVCAWKAPFVPRGLAPHAGMVRHSVVANKLQRVFGRSPGWRMAGHHHRGTDHMVEIKTPAGEFRQSPVVG